MISGISPQILTLYAPLSSWEAFYLRTRWRLCPLELVESHLPKSGRILDFGCGYGMLSNYAVLKSPQRSVVGVDLSEARIRIARRSIRGRMKAVEFYHIDVRDLDSPPFDAAVMTDVLHHIDDQNASSILHAVHSMLADKAPLVILDVDRRPFSKFFVTYLIDRLLNPGSSLHYRSKASMLLLLDRASFGELKAIAADPGLPLSDVLYLSEKIPRNRT
jgi:cyclopropane fatty-acyl-phospholipid synthase-like methyltransferase